ncbi:hypothetical protein [Acuticoccus kandeliae]|uniref:hypothetical protein n=1 Tax=Acuticoccus kandeliae TaxID=2073160 RepID=UPI0013002043|nr:hypothetical protein [Acuticoccus kandeliae]
MAESEQPTGKTEAESAGSESIGANTSGIGSVERPPIPNDLGRPPISGHEMGRQPNNAGGPFASPAVTPLENLQFRAIMNASYHQDMERFYDQVHRVLMFVVVLAGSSAVVSILPTTWAAGIATVAGLIDLVFDLFGKAALHKQLRWRALNIFAESYEPAANHEILGVKLARMYPDEPPENGPTLNLAYNRANQALGWSEGARLWVPWWARIFRHVVPWILYRRETLAERKKRLEGKQHLAA